MRTKVAVALAAAGLVLAYAGCRGAPRFLFGVPAPTPRMVSGEVDVPALVHQRCHWCHSPERPNLHHMSREDWTSTIDLMIHKGARLNADERQALIDYLSKRDEALAATTQPAH